MAAKRRKEMEVKTVECTFQWKIENVSQCWWIENRPRIASPTFVAGKLEGTKWSLWLYLMGYNEDENEVDEIAVKLHREIDCEGPDLVEVKYTLAFLGENGLILEERTHMGRFSRDQTSLFLSLEDQKRVFITDREKFVPEDILTVQCTLRKAEKKADTKGLVESKNLYARTVFNVIRESFDWRIDNFSTLRHEIRKKFKNDFIEFDLVLGGDSDKTLNIDMISLHDCIKYYSFQTSIMDSDGKKKSFRPKRCFVNGCFKKGMLSPMLDFATELEDKNRYLQNDVFPLDFDTVLSTVEHSDFGKKSVKSIGQEKYESMTILTEDLKSMYNDRLYSDIVLRTNTQDFSAHKSILSARSPVFRKMFSSDMRETNSGFVQIEDIEYDIVDRMLLFMYTGIIEELQLESASELYTAADKYEILSLKIGCSSFLKENLSPENACQVLLLVDRHQDDDLKNFVLDYILDHGEIFKSSAWKRFMEENRELASNIMYRKLTR